MRSRAPKVTHPVGGRPMLEHVLRAASAAVAAADDSADEPGGDSAEDHSPHYVVVVGHEREQVLEAVSWAPTDGALVYIEQEPQRGTGDAVRVGVSAWDDPKARPGTILVAYGDTPIIRAETLEALLREHERSGAALTFLTGMSDRPTDYGRVLRDSAGQVSGIVEVKHATAEELQIPEVNSGIYCFAADWLESRIVRLGSHANGEYYLTDLIEVAVREGRTISTVSTALDETMGVNDRVQLAEAERILRERILRDLMLAGVTVQDPATTYIEAGVRVGEDTTLLPGTILRGATTIGSGCTIGPYSVIADSTIGDGCIVAGSWLEGAVMESGSRVGPMSRLRSGAHLKAGADVGNFGEVKNATIGEHVDMHHFSYIGDASVGAGTNIGAGTITMNYDGREKHHTEIGENAFIGCDTLLRAPVTIGDGAATGGGSVVTRDVPPGKLAVGMPARVTQRVKSAASAETRRAEPATATEDSAPQANGEAPAAVGHASPYAGTDPDEEPPARRSTT
jgi:bifunctional UDP-N-acetylglucosamine pyrophosphorylase / glucosamine-1-phosphate N-acetyltransferase